MNILKKISVWVLAFMMLVTFTPMFAFAADTEGDVSKEQSPANIEEPSDTSDPVQSEESSEDTESQEEVLGAASEDEMEACDDDDWDFHFPSGEVICVDKPDSDYDYETEDDYRFLYCEEDSDLEVSVKGLSYDPDECVLTMKGYTGPGIIIQGIDELTINLKGTSYITPVNNDNYGTCIYAPDTELTVQGSYSIYMKGKKLYDIYWDEDEEEYYKDYYYPDGLYCKDLTVDGTNIKGSYLWDGICVNGSDDEYGSLEMRGGSLALSYSKDYAVSVYGDVDIHGGTVSGGYSFQEIYWDDNDGSGEYYYSTVVGKPGVLPDTDEDSDYSYNSKVAKTVTVKGGLVFSGDYGDFEWTINSLGKLSIVGEGVLKEDPDDEYPWIEYDRRIKSIALGEGITGVEDTVFDGCYNATSISLPSTLEFISPIIADKLKTYKVATGNNNYTVYNGVLLSKDKTRLEAYPTGKVVKSYTIPSSVQVIGENAFCEASIKTLILPKKLVEIENNGITQAFINTVKVASGNAMFNVKSGVLYGNCGTTLEWYSPLNKQVAYTIPEGIDTIASKAFASNTKVISIIVPETVNLLKGYDNFGERDSILDVIFMGNAPEVEEEPSVCANFVAGKNSEGWDDDVWTEVVTLVEDPQKYYPESIFFNQEQYEGEVDDEVVLKIDYEPGSSFADNLIFKSSSTNLTIGDFDSDSMELTVTGKVMGTYTVTASTPNGVSGSCNVVLDPYFDEDSIDMYVSDTYKNKLVGSKGTITWTSDDKSVATVSYKGTVTAKSEGDCVIQAKVGGKYYYYELSVFREYPGYQDVYVDYYSYSKNSFYIDIENLGDHTFYIYSAGAYSYDCDDEYWDRKLKLSSSYITVKPGAFKTIRFIVVGNKLKYWDDWDEEWYVYDAEDAEIWCKVGINGKKYDAILTTEGGEYYDPEDDEWYDLGGNIKYDEDYDY